MLALNTWNPWNELADLHRDLDAIVGRVFRDAGGRSNALNSFNAPTSSVDIRRADDGWKVAIPVPGIDPSEIEIDLDGRHLRVRGEAGNGQSNGSRYSRVEQQLTLPDDIDTEKVNARYHLGVLELTLPLKESAKPRRIQVEMSSETKRLKAA